MNKKLRGGIIIGVIILLVIASQLFAIRMIYARQLSGDAALFLSKLYNLKAGTIVSDGRTLRLPLSEYFENAYFVRNFLIKNVNDSISDDDVDQVAWNKLLKNTWLLDLAKNKNLEVTSQDVDDQLSNIDDQAQLDQAKADLGMNDDEYRRLVVKPFILEAKVYEYLIDNYNDQAGVARVQEAYDALASGQKFDDVAAKYSDDTASYEQSQLIAESQLTDFYEPIKELQEGQYSKIVKIPGAYLIWYVDSIVDGEEKNYEVRSIVIIAKTLDEFFQDFISASQVNRLY